MKPAAAAGAVLLAFASCVPELGERDSLIEEPTIVAVRADPPEAAPGARVRFEVVVAMREGVVAAPLARWDFCASAKLLTENGAVAAACLGNAAGVLPIASAAPSVDAPIPSNACNVFGPRTLVQDQRPRDADITGGYYQPIRVAYGGRLAFGFERIECGPPLAPIRVVEEYGRRYKANANPTLARVEAPAAAARGARSTLRASWPAESAEPFVVYDLAAQALVDHRESMRVSWYATAGTFTADRTGREESELELFTDNTWTAPDAAQVVHFVVVLRDPRGGLAWSSFDMQVE